MIWPATAFRTGAMALTDDSISIADPVLTSEPRLAIVMGTEGEGLPPDTIAAADYVVRIRWRMGLIRSMWRLQRP